MWSNIRECLVELCPNVGNVNALRVYVYDTEGISGINQPAIFYHARDHVARATVRGRCSGMPRTILANDAQSLGARCRLKRVAEVLTQTRAEVLTQKGCRGADSDEGRGAKLRRVAEVQTPKRVAWIES